MSDIEEDFEKELNSVTVKEKEKNKEQDQVIILQGQKNQKVNSIHESQIIDSQTLLKKKVREIGDGQEQKEVNQCEQPIESIVSLEQLKDLVDKDKIAQTKLVLKDQHKKEIEIKQGKENENKNEEQEMKQIVKKQKKEEKKNQQNQLTEDEIQIFQKFNEIIYKFDDKAELVVTKPRLLLLATLIHVYDGQRKNFVDNKKITIRVEQLEVQKAQVIHIFEYYPSIRLIIDDEEIENNSIIKCEGFLFFEGKVERMFIYHQQTGTRYHGSVNNSQQCKYHGEGSLLFAPEQKVNKYHYTGQFVNGVKEGFGREARKNSLYEGQWKNDLKDGHGQQQVLKKRRRNARPSETIQQPLQQQMPTQTQTVVDQKQKKQEQKQVKSVQQVKKTKDFEQLEDDQEEDNSKKEEKVEKQVQQEKQKSLDLISFSQESESKIQSSQMPSEKQYPEKKMQKIIKLPPTIKYVYRGNYSQGCRSGKGLQMSKNGTYQGEWLENVKHGYGTMEYNNGAVYSGEWKNGFLCGNGTYIDEIKNTYNGNFENGLFHGEGTMQYSNGDKYEGFWQCGKKHGKGLYTYSDEDYYDGQWVKDDAEGAGDSMINGIFYTGSWTKGKKHGMGEETDEDGNTVKGIWKNNVLIEKIEMEEDEDDD